MNGATPLLPSRQIAILTALITSPKKHTRMRRRSELSESVHWSGAVRSSSGSCHAAVVEEEAARPYLRDTTGFLGERLDSAPHHESGRVSRLTPQRLITVKALGPRMGARTGT